MAEREVTVFDDPVESGWYATLHTWDVNEGLFPGAHYWDGAEWRDRPRSGLLSHWPVVFDSEEAAKEYAYEHDPENV